MSIQEAYDVYDTLPATGYTIIVRKGKAGGNLIIMKEEFKDYELAMSRLDEVERCYGNRYWIDFRTHYV
jgi:hypothetical protein